MLTVQNLSYKHNKKLILNNISLELGSGIYGLLGPNGSGKTTLLRCIAGVLSPHTGIIIKPHSIGYLPQAFGVFPELTVYEALEYFATLKNIPAKYHRECINQSIEYVDLCSRKNDRVRTLSGGMIRRLGIAQAILGDPDLVLVDEPTNGLDPEERIRFKNLIIKLREKKTVIISTHLIDDVEFLCNHIILLNHGNIISQETAEELRHFAEGKVYTIPVSAKTQLIPPFYIKQEDAKKGDNLLQVLSSVKQPGTLVNPTLEDGYILKIRV